MCSVARCLCQGCTARLKPCPFEGQVQASERLVFGCQIFQLPTPVQLFDETGLFAPTGADLDEQFQKDFRAQPPFNLEAGGGADLLEHTSALADDDPLLSFALAVNRGCDVGELG